MQGDPKVDELMRPVNAAIDRHVKDRDAKVDIYNRAYEAVQNGMDYLANGTYCAYCGAEFPFDDHIATLVGEHIRTCEKHPMRAAELRAEKAEGELDEFIKIHPRAVKLLRKKKNFLVVAEDEPYFFKVYVLLRAHEKEIGRWTDEDENNYQKARRAYYERPIDLPDAVER